MEHRTYLLIEVLLKPDLLLGKLSVITALGALVLSRKL